eukprot:COSAG01_NODE_5732_length_4070_cov_3.053135_4_plen_357_part_01
MRSSLGASGLALPIVDSHAQLPACEEGDPPSLIYQTDAALNMQQLLTCSSQDGAPAWRSVLVQGGLIYHGPDGVAWAAAVGSGLPGILQLDLPRQPTTISIAVHVVNGQRARVVGTARSTLAFAGGVTVADGGALTLDGGGDSTFSGQVTVTGALTLDGGGSSTFSSQVTVTGALTLDGGGSVAFAGGVTVADGGALTLGSPLTLVDGAAALLDLAYSAGRVSFGSGGVTLADAHGATLGTATGAWPGDVRLTHLTHAGKTAFGASTASATVSRDVHGVVTASGITGAFASASGPCTLSSGNTCVERMPYGNNERCSIVVGWGGTLGACPSFNTEQDYDILTIDGIQYSGSDSTNSR